MTTLWFLLSLGLPAIDAIQSRSPEPYRSAPIEVLAHVTQQRSCHNDDSIFTEYVDLDLLFRNTSSRRVNIYPTSSFLARVLVADSAHDLQKGNYVWDMHVDTIREQDDADTVALWPGESFLVRRTTTIPIQRRHGVQLPALLRYGSYSMVVVTALRIGEDDNDSAARPRRHEMFRSLPLPLEIASSRPMEFCD